MRILTLANSYTFANNLPKNQPLPPERRWGTTPAMILNIKKENPENNKFSGLISA